MKENRSMENTVLFIAVSLMLTWAQVICVNSDDCPLWYQRYSTSHSYCQPKNSFCNILNSGLTQKEVDQILQIHNFYRSIIATQQKQSNGLPAAADMLSMEWDNELAAIAQRHADRCDYGHDKADQRRVINFGVGQNIAKAEISGSNLQPPQPDWSSTIESFFNEIKHFSKEMVCGSRNHPPGDITHFTQVVWSRSYRIGCGYIMFKHENTYERHYVCNYGPGGNNEKACVYKPGPACSKCPKNTQCTTGSQSPGLCKKINEEAPYQPYKVPHIFNCNFRNPTSEDCKVYTVGGGKWFFIQALSGTYLETVLQPGQNRTVVFSNRFTPSLGAKQMCIQVKHRYGPNLAKDTQNIDAKALLVTPSSNDDTVDYTLVHVNKNAFTTYGIGMEWASTTELKLSFAVPKGAAPQFVNVQSVVGFNGKCIAIEE